MFLGHLGHARAKLGVGYTWGTKLTPKIAEHIHKSINENYTLPKIQRYDK